jgi:hypothetical protein
LLHTSQRTPQPAATSTVGNPTDGRALRVRRPAPAATSAAACSYRSAQFYFGGSGGPAWKGALHASSGRVGRASGRHIEDLSQALPWRAVLTADRIDYWIRRRVIACPLGPTGDAPRSANARTLAPLPALPRAAACPSIRPPRVERPPRSQPALACDRRAWLAALGRSLKAEYEALAAPMPSRLAVLVKQLEAQP